MQLRRRLMQARDVFAMRAHHGWLHFLAEKASSARITSGIARRIQAYLGRRSDLRSVAFDEEHGTETFTRGFFPVSEDGGAGHPAWGYGPVNQDFFREILCAVPFPLSRFAFVDVGAGKGAALMLASEFGFRRYVGVELTEDLIAVGRANVAKYRAATSRTFEPEWVQIDFMKWTVPREDTLLFLNNPFPKALSLDAVKKITADVAEGHARTLLVYRKVPGNVGAYLNTSRFWTPLRLAPYWRVYASPALVREVGASVGV